ncbi:MAG TPA: A/G-specific adenine glycosylase [Gammaproteobacteria bacterium]|nr:A/G-specific adenine glycosylase [Gammaproteobacteria bacterium]
MPASLSPKRFQQIALNWFDQYGRKNFPWQQNKTPYSVWLSEIMLQQTQVTTVIPYYQRFLSQFPDVTALANAKEDEVLHLWAGLGYYSRARNLHRTAKMVQQQWNGQFPDNVEELQKLPGIGRSTAGAIVSCAFYKKAAILDGNVKRLLTRFHGVTDPIDLPKTQAQLWELAEQYTPADRVADYSQVMMDLGATICTRKNPRCNECPLQTYCLAHQTGIANELPTKKAKRAIPIREATFLVLRYQDKVLLQKRPSIGIWGGLWSLPQLAEKVSLNDVKEFCRESFKLNPKTAKSLKPFRHTFSHFHLDIHPVEITLSAVTPKAMDGNSLIWYSLNQPEALGLPAPVQSLLESIGKP